MYDYVHRCIELYNSGLVCGMMYISLHIVTLEMMRVNLNFELRIAVDVDLHSQTDIGMMERPVSLECNLIAIRARISQKIQHPRHSKDVLYMLLQSFGGLPYDWGVHGQLFGFEHLTPS